VSWVRVDCDVPMDGRLCGSGHAWAWPAVIVRAKKGQGTVSTIDLSPRAMAHLWGPSVEAWDAALAYFHSVGLLVAEGDDVVVAGWDEYQRDLTGAERQRASREKKRHVTSRDVTRQDVTVTNVTADSTVQDSTIQDKTVAADAATTRAHAPAREAATAATTGDQLGAVAERWRLALRGKTGAAPLVVGALDIDALSAAVAERGADYVMKCIDRSAEVAGGGGPSLSLLRMILRDGVHEPKPTKSGQGRTKSDKPNDHDPKRVNDAWVDVPDQGYTF
jgi:hypothetical protein